MKRLSSILLSLLVAVLLVFGITACNPTAPKYYEVYFETYGYVDVITQNVKENETATEFEAPVCDTHDFAGWYLDEGYTQVFNFDEPITQDVVVYAKWTEKESTYTITFDKNGHGKAPQKQYIEAGTNGKITKPADLSANGWKFIGWSLNKDDSVNLIDFNSFIPTSSITLYAQWKQTFVVSFDLNNEEALIAPPENQTVISGELATRPTVDPTVMGYVFDGWYMDKDGVEAFDFSAPISKRMTLYAKWSENRVGSIDGSGLPSYDWEKDSAYGERPDLDGYVIDGKMGEDENWEEQNWYHTGITEAPTVSFDLTTRLSDKGLYFFVKAVDNGGLAFTGRGYYYKNTGFDIGIINGDLTVGDANKLKTISFDTYNAKPSILKFKLATRIIEGSVNPDIDNKTGVWTTECFITWKELGMSEKPSTVRIFPQYNYKRVMLDEKTIKLTPTFLTSNAIGGYTSFIQFNDDGYMLADKENATLGDSPFGIAKTSGWEIDNVDNSENAYLDVNNSATGMQAIFFKNALKMYYSAQTDVTIKPETTASGDIGLMVYDNAKLYVSYLVDMSASTYGENGFTSVKTKSVYTNDAGVAVTNPFNAITLNQPVKNLTLRLIFSNGYIYFILNGKLIHCQYEIDFNERNNVAIVSQNARNVRLINYSSSVYTQEEASKVSSAYARMISIVKSNNVSATFSSIGQAVEDPQPVTMYLKHRNVTLTNQYAEMMLDGDFSRIVMYEIDKVTVTPTGEEETDASDVMLGGNGIKYGKYVFDLIKKDMEISFYSRKVDVEELTIITANLKDMFTGLPLDRAGDAEIYSNDSRISNYSSTVLPGRLIIPVKKGYDYELEISVPGYRTKRISYKSESALTNVQGVVSLGEIVMETNVVGGTATSPNSSFTMPSAIALWDYSNEENGEVIVETFTAQSTQAYFSGDVISKYQIAEVKIANLTDKVEHPSYEKDPAAGFCITNKTGSSNRKFIGLHKNGLRILHTRSGGWNPTDLYYDFLPSTVNKVDTTGNSYTTLTMLKIGRGDYADVFIYVNGIFTTKLEMDGIGDETAIGFDITTSYYLKLKFFDYWIKTGEEALDKAKELLGNTIVLDDSCYELNYDTWEADYTKPLIKVENLAQFPYLDGVQEVALLGNKIKISLNEEFTIDNIAYFVEIGEEKYILTSNSPSLELEIKSSGEEIVIKAIIKPSATVTGRVLIDGNSAGEVEGKMVALDGTVITFTTGADGTFSIDVMASTTYYVSFSKNMYVSEVDAKRVGTSAIDFGDFTLMPVVFGGEGSSNQAKWGYGYDDGTNKIEGLYTEVDAKADNTQIYTYKPINNAIIDFSFVRLDIPAVTDEQYPSIGVCIITEDGVREFYGVQYSGGLILDGKDQWNAPIKASNVLSFTTKGFNFHFDVRVVKYGNVVSIFAKLPADTEYTYIMTHTSRFNLNGATIGLRVTAGAPTHHIFYNEKVTEFDDNTLPTDVARTLNISAKEGGTFEVVNAKSQYVVGETVQIKVIPQSEKTAFIRVNGSEYFYPNEDGIIAYTVKQNANNIEVYFEDTAEDITVTGKLVATSGVTLPSTFDFSIHFEDGRVYNVNDVEIASDGSFAFNFREGEYTVRGTKGSIVAKTISGKFTLSSCSLGNLEVYDIFLGGRNESYNSTSEPTYGYDYDDGVNQIAGPYMEVNQRGNCYMALRVGKVKDFEFSFTYVRKIAEGYENEQWPAVGLIFADSSGSESYLFQDKGALVLEKGVGWSKPVKYTNKLTKSMYTENLAFDYKIVRKGDTFTFYGKVATDSSYTKIGEYTSKTSFGELETRFVVTAASTQVRFLLYNMSYTAL